jgi:hypothetical protein
VRPGRSRRLCSCDASAGGATLAEGNGPQVAAWRSVVALVCGSPMIQWHPIFALLLRPLLEDYYEVRTDVPVGDRPRAADIVLLRQTAAGAPPFTGLWRWLTAWNILEFKGPTVSARLDDLDRLLELGLGIHRHLNKEASKRRQPRVGRADVSLWYLANHLGRRFLRAAEELLGPLESLGVGLWRVEVLHRRLVLVSGRKVPVDRDSLPVHLLTIEPEEQQQAVVQVLGQSRDLWPAYSGWLASAHPALAKEVAGMGRAKTGKSFFDFRAVIEHLGWQEVIRQTGLKSLLDEVGLDQLVAQLSPQQRRELQRLLQERTGPGP